MKTETKEIYKCDHCNKLYQRKHACISHEPKCRKNPLNIPKCVGCKYLTEVDIEYQRHYETFGDCELSSSSAFRCEKKDVFMYHPIVELGEYGVPDYSEFEGNEIEQHRMPTSCEEWEEELF